MHRRILGLATAGLLLTATGMSVAPRAVAAAGNRTIVSRIGLPPRIAAGSVACPNGHGTTGYTAVHIDGPATPPLGTGSLRISAPASSVPLFSEKLSQNQLTHLTRMAISTNSIDAPNLYDFVQFASDSTTPVGAGTTDLLYLAVTSPKWNTRNLLTATLTWHRDGVADPIGTGTLAQYVAAHPSARVLNWGAGDFSCESQSSRFAVDDVQLGGSGATTTYNFEAAIPTKLSIDVLPHTVAVGTPIHLTGTLRAAGKPLSDARVVLWRRAAGAQRFHPLLTARTNAAGELRSKRLHPPASTTYQWRYAGTSTYASVYSVRLRVPVAISVTLGLASGSVAKGDPVVATGTVNPARTGTTVTLWSRQHGGRATQVATGRLKPDGKYRIAATFRSGSYEVFTTVAADGVNTAGESGVHTLFVG